MKINELTKEIEEQVGTDMAEDIFDRDYLYDVPLAPGSVSCELSNSILDVRYCFRYGIRLPTAHSRAGENEEEVLPGPADGILRESSP